LTTSTTSTTPNLSFNASNTGFSVGATVAGNYLQSILQNKSGTAGASTNYVLSNDLGTDSTYYGEFGMNSSVFSASTPFDFFSINNGIYFSGHDGDITVGSGNGYKYYMAWGTTGQSAHVINASGAIGFSTNLGTTPALSGTTGYGTAGQVPISAGSTGAVVWSSTPTLTGTNFTGVPISTAISGLNTGVATALAVAVGSAGAFVVNGGALGTPTSGTLTNCTGLPNAGLVNSSVTFNGVSVALGASGTITAVNPNALTISSPLSGTSYNGSSAVTIALAAGYGDTQNPFASKTANYFLAAPNGTAGAPTFRAIVAADIPTLNQNTTGTASNVTGIVAIANGGTGTATANANVVFAGPTTGAAAAPSFRVLVAADIPSTYSEFAAGTALLFYQAAAPTGWTKSTTNDNKALRVVSGATGGSSGGTVAFTTAFASQTPAGTVSTSITGVAGSVGVSGTVGNTTITTSTMPSHAHGALWSLSSTVGNSMWAPNTGGPTNINNIQSNGSDGAHSHGFSGSGSFTFSSGTASSSFSGSAINLAVQYIDVIVATKN
jgi:hypothetical protein